MSTLTSLSGDVLATILDDLDLASIGQVFLIGNRLLRAKIIRTHALTRVEVKGTRQQIKEEPLVRSVMFPRLTRLSQIGFLPYFPCIRHLVLDFSGHPVVCDGVEALLSLSLTWLTLKMDGASLLLRDAQNSPIRRLDLIFPALTTLEWMELNTSNRMKFSESELEQIGRNLPTSLTRLQMGIFWRPPHSLLANIPTSITDISIVCSELSWISRKPLPAAILRLEFLVAVEGTSNPFLGDLPPSLTDLSIGPIPGKSSFSRPTYSMMSFHSSRYLHFPSTLTSLRLRRESLLRSDHIEHLPGALTQLIAKNTKGVSDSDIAKLPQSLTHLEIGSRVATDESFNCLPPSLTILWCNFTITQNTFQPISRIPASVTSFTHRQAETYSLPLRQCPPHLRKLGLPLAPPAFKSLPKTLETLKLEYPLRLPSADVLSTLPANLKRLFIRGRVTVLRRNSPSHLLTLPPSLTQLHVPHGQLVIPANFTRLPKTLTYLYLNSYLTTQNLAEFPPTLTNFYTETIIIVSNVSQLIMKKYHELTHHKQIATSANATPPLFGSPLFNSSTESELHLHANDFFEAAKTLVPQSVTTVPCLFFSLPLTCDLLSPLSSKLTTLDLSLTSSLFGDPQLSWLVGSTTTYQESRILQVNLSNRLCGFHKSHAPYVNNLKTLIMRPPINDHRLSREEMPFGTQELEVLPTTLTHLQIEWVFGPFRKSCREDHLEELAPDVFEKECQGERTKTEPFAQDLGTWLIRLRSLTHLTITWNQDFSRYLPHLPIGLLSLRFLTATLDAIDFAHLPRGLTELTCQHYRIDSPTDFERLPRLLKRFDFGNDNAGRLPGLLVVDPISVQGPCTALLHPVNSSWRQAYNEWKKYVESEATPLPAELTELDLADVPLALLSDLILRLPAALTRLMLPPDYTFPTSSLSQLPVNLTSIHGGSMVFCDDDIRALPEDLQALNWDTLFSTIRQHLPPKLTDLQLHSYGDKSAGLDTTLLPPSIKMIDLHGSWRLPFSTLLRNLEVLRLFDLESNSDLALADVPGTLRELSIPAVDLSLDQLPYFPSQLTHLDLRKASTISGAHFRTLPPTLTHLNLASSPALDTQLSELPPPLTFLQLGKTTITGKYSIDLETITLFTLVSAAQLQLPKGIRNQAITEWSISLDRILKNLNKRVTRHIMLPAKRIEPSQPLTSMKKETVYIVPDTPDPLPLPSSPAIRNQDFSNVSLAPVSKETLRRLEALDPQENSNPAPITVHWEASLSISVDTSILPSDLETFIMHYAQIAPESLVSLSPQLATLRLPHANNITSEMVTVLPKSLTDLELRFCDIYPKRDIIRNAIPQEVLSALPPHLTRFSAGPIVYTGASTADLKIE